MRIGFYQSTRPDRTPIYSLSGEKLCYMIGDSVSTLEGRLVARIIRYKDGRELTATQSACGSTIVTPAELNEV